MGYFFRFWAQVIRRALYIIRNRRKETRRADALIDGLETRYSGKFHTPTRRKIAVSYGIYNPMICDAFTALHGRSTNDAEKERFFHYFVCSSLFDDFTDVLVMPESELLALSFQPEAFTPETFEEAVFRDSHLLLKSFVREPTTYEALTRGLFRAQWDSKNQARPGVLSEEALRDITFRKGGLSVLLCSFYMDYTPTPAERDCWYRIGTIIQLTNDLFDIYKDVNDRMDTLPVRMKDIPAFRAFFEDQIRGMQTAITALEVTERCKRPFRMAMMGICAFGLIALDQLAEIGPILPPTETLSRKQLVIDMEKTRNLCRWLRYAYRRGHA